MIPILEFDKLAPQDILNRDIRAEANVDAAVDAVLAEVSTSMTMVKYSCKTVWVMSRMLMLCWASREQTEAVMPTLSLPMTVTIAFIVYSPFLNG